MSNPCFFGAICGNEPITSLWPELLQVEALP
jgi:hypothetical protein